MEAMLRTALLSQVQMQCRFVLWAHAALTRSVRGRRNPQRAFYAIQALLAATGNVSKALWGGKSERALRAPLRALLRVGDDSPLYQRDVRNSFEHYDHDLSEYLATASIVIDSNLGPVGAVSIPGARTLRNYNPQTGVVSFLDTTFNVPAVVKEVRRILRLVDSELRDYPWGRNPMPRRANPQVS
jgi:hypothetical protein